MLNLAYRAQRDRLEQAEVSGAWPLGKRWNAYGRAVYSLRDSELLERFRRLRIPRLLLAGAGGGAPFDLESRGHAGDELLPAAGTERSVQCRKCGRFPGTHNSRILAGNFRPVKNNYMISKAFSRAFLVLRPAFLAGLRPAVRPDPRSLSSGVLLDRVAATVNEGVVLSSELDEELLSISERLRAQKLDLPPMNVLRQQVLDRLVLQELQIQRANRAGIKVSDESVNNALRDVAETNKIRARGSAGGARGTGHRLRQLSRRACARK